MEKCKFFSASVLTCVNSEACSSFLPFFSLVLDIAGEQKKSDGSRRRPPTIIDVYSIALYFLSSDLSIIGGVSFFEYLCHILVLVLHARMFYLEGQIEICRRTD